MILNVTPKRRLELLAEVSVKRFDMAASGGWYLAITSLNPAGFQAGIEAIKDLATAYRRYTPDAPGGAAWWIDSRAVATLVKAIPALEMWRYRWQAPGTPTPQRVTPMPAKASRMADRPFNVASAYTYLRIAPDATRETIHSVYEDLARQAMATQAYERVRGVTLAYNVIIGWLEKQEAA